jgi:hypothetical protein
MNDPILNKVCHDSLSHSQWLDQYDIRTHHLRQNSLSKSSIRLLKDRSIPLNASSITSRRTSIKSRRSIAQQPCSRSAERVFHVRVIRGILHGRGDGREVPARSATQHRSRRWRISINRGRRERSAAAAGHRAICTRRGLAIGYSGIWRRCSRATRAVIGLGEVVAWRWVPGVSHSRVVVGEGVSDGAGRDIRGEL